MIDVVNIILKLIKEINPKKPIVDKIKINEKESHTSTNDGFKKNFL